MSGAGGGTADGPHGTRGARGMHGTPRREDPRVARTRRAIVEATETLLRRRAAEGIAVADVVACAGISKSTFYCHYGSLDDLYRHMEDRLFLESLGRFKGVLGQLRDRPAGFLREFADYAYESPLMGSGLGVGVTPELMEGMVRSAGEAGGEDDAAVLEMTLMGVWSMMRRLPKGEFLRRVPALARFLRHGFAGAEE